MAGSEPVVEDANNEPQGESVRPEEGQCEIAGGLMVKGSRQRDAKREPSVKEVEEHMIDHLPYRSWCKFCVRGRCKGKAHKTGEGENNKIEGWEVPVISVDYAFMKKQNDNEDAGQPIIITRDRRDKWLSANVVPRKGVEDFAVNGFVSEIFFPVRRRRFASTIL